MHPEDPPRLGDADEGGPLRDAIRGLRAERPSDTSAKAIEAKVLAAIAAGAVVGTAVKGGAAAKATTGASLLLKVGLAVVVSTGLVVAIAYTRSPAPAPAPSVTTTPAPSASTPPPVEKVVAPVDVASAAPSISAAPKPQPSTPAADNRELTLLREAQSSLLTSPSKTLALTVEHASEYPNSKMFQERELLAITALVRLGRKEEARARAARFRARHPDSAYVHRIDAVLE